MDALAAQSLLLLAEETSPRLRGPDAKAALQVLEDRHADWLAALDWFIGHGHTDEGLRLASSLYRYWISQQRFEEGATWFDRTLDMAGGEPRLRGAATVNAAFMPFWLGRDERAAELFGRGLEIGRDIADPGLVSQALGGLARVAFRGDVAEGRRLAREALDVSVAASDEAGRPNALHPLGVGAQIAGDLSEARQWMTERLALVRTTGNEFLIASEASNLSMVERQLGNLQAAEELAREAVEICERTGDQFTRPFAIAGLAAIAAERGDAARAATLLGVAEAIMSAQNMAWPPDERPHYEHLLNVLPQQLGRARFERARAEGRALTPARAVAVALEVRPASEAGRTRYAG